MQLIILMGKSLSGKTYLEHKLANNNIIDPIITSTTRPKRNGEINGKTYYFVNNQEYQKALTNHEALAPREYHVAHDETWSYYLDKTNLIKQFMSATHERPKLLILDLKGYLDLFNNIKQSNDPILKKLHISGLYLDIPIKKRIERYLTTPRSHDDSQEFVRRLYDDEFNAFKDLDKPEYCKKYRIKIVNSNLDALLYLEKYKMKDCSIEKRSR